MATRQNVTLPNFVSGELSPFMEGRVDLELFAKSMSWCQNFVCLPQGGSSYRAGTLAVGLTRGNAAGVFIPFQFSANDAHMIVATGEKFRFYRNDAVVLNTAKNVTGVTNANPAVVTSTSHGYANGTEVFMTAVEGMPQINGRFYKVANAAANTFELQDQFGTNVDSTGYGTYEAATGTVASIFELTTPYVEADLEFLRYAQTADLMYITSQAYDPRKLVRTDHTNWSINTYSRTNDPFTSATKQPALVAFTADGRLAFANTEDNPEGVWESRAPNGTTTRYDDFTTGSNATDAVIFNLAPVEGIIDAIQELKGFGRLLVALGASSIRRIFGANPDVPATPANINADPTIEGSARVRPIVIGGTMLFVDVSGKKLKGFQFNLGKDLYEAKNFQLIAEHLGEVAFKRIVRVKGDPDAVWVLRNDGLLFSFTYNDNENIAGWARHPVGGDGVVEDIATIRKSTGEDQLWMIVKRVMGGKTYRSIEVMSAWPQFPQKRSFYTGAENKDADLEAYENVTWERLKTPTFLDMTLSFDGTARGVVKNATLTPSAVTGNNITITSNNAVFRADQIGQQIWKKYASDGSGGGQAVITGFNSTTSVTARVQADFDNVNAIAPGSWEFAVEELLNLHLFEGLEVDVQADGSSHSSETVTQGRIALQHPASHVHVGFIHRGFMATQNIDLGSQSGPGNSKPRNITRVRARLKDTIGGKVGSSEYALQELVFREDDQIMGRVPPPLTGVYDLNQIDTWKSDSKQVVIIQEDPTPCTIVALDVEVNTVD